ncbi:MAG: hypothetical protein KDB23_00610 [Planctomycetales bacterium]|nr:hypothetical protein [Planctomycetales bacterium]
MSNFNYNPIRAQVTEHTLAEPARRMAIRPQRRHVVERLETRTLLACNFPTPNTAFNNYDIPSEPYVGSSENISDCLNVSVEGGDIISFELEFLDAIRNGYPNTIVEMLNPSGQRVIGSKFAFVDQRYSSNDNYDLLPKNETTGTPWVLAVDRTTGTGREDQFVHFVYHAPITGQYTIQAVPGALTGDYQMTVLKRRPVIESYPNGSRQYLYLNFSGVEQLSLTSFGQNKVSDVTDIGAFLSRFGRGLLTDSESDIRLFTTAVVEYLEVQYPPLRGCVLNSLDHAAWKDLPYVSEIIVGETSEQAVSSAELEDQGNFALNDKVLIAFSPASQPNLNGINSVQLCTDNCQRDFDGSLLDGRGSSGQKQVLLSYLSQFVGRYIAHEFGHSTGNTHVLYPTTLERSSAIMTSPAVIDPLEGLEPGNLFVGKTSKLNLRYGTDDNWLMQFYASFANEQEGRMESVMEARGAQPGFFHNLTNAELYGDTRGTNSVAGVPIVAGELIYTTHSAESLVIESDTNGDVRFYRCQNPSMTTCGEPIYSQDDVTKVRLVSIDAISHFDSSKLTVPLSVDGAWQAHADAYLDTDYDGGVVTAGELIYGGTHTNERVVISPTDGTLLMTVNGNVIGSVTDMTDFRLIGRGGDDVVTLPTTVSNAFLGDLDGDHRLNSTDIDELMKARKRNDTNRVYDLNGDGLVDERDTKYMIHVLFDTIFGDADLNGFFDSGDLINVFAAGHYEDDHENNAFWSVGDWDGDGEFNTSDLVWAFQDGGYR